MYKFEYFSLLISNIEVYFSTYGVIFLLYLIVRFSNTNLRHNFVRDNNAGREVPAMVFIRNRSIVDCVEAELTSNEVKRREARLKAEMNEYFYTLMKENRISSAIDEDISVSFFD